MPDCKEIEAMEIGNLLTKIKEGSSSVIAVLATIWNSACLYSNYQKQNLLQI